MSKELEEIKTLRGFNQVELNNDKNINKSLDVIEQALLKADKNKKIIDELKTLVKYADLGKQKIISLAVLKNALKEVL